MFKISAVIVSRNDNYSENLIERAYNALRTSINFFDEIVYVDWNSPSDKTLTEELKDDLDLSKVKTIKITQEHLDKMKLPEDAQQCTEVLGRNIGIRNAKNDWILSTNIDIVFIPPENNIILEENTMYTTRRYNIHRDNILKLRNSFPNAVDLINFLKQNLDKLDRVPFADYNDKYSLVRCCGDFQLAHKKIWNEIRGFEESMIYRCFADTNLLLKAKAHGFETKILDDIKIVHLNHDSPSYNKHNSEVKFNDKCYITNFEKTKNKESWGLFE